MTEGYYEYLEGWKYELHGDIICNQCGESTLLPKNTSTAFPAFPQYPYGLSAIADGGYSSEYLEDETRYTFYICESCLTKLFVSFKIKPKESNYFDRTSIDRVQEIIKLYSKINSIIDNGRFPNDTSHMKLKRPNELIYQAQCLLSELKMHSALE